MLILLHDATSAGSVLEALGLAAETARTFLSATPPLIAAPDGERAQVIDHPAVVDVLEHAGPYPLASRRLHPSTRRVNVGGVTFGGDEVVVIAGPCSAEGPEQLTAAAEAVRARGARLLRAGVFKPRTSPYAFQGLGHPGLPLLADVSARTGLPAVTEVMDPRDVAAVAEHAACLQVGARNMQNFMLLKELGSAGKPVLLKRGFGCTVEELLSAAEYIMAHGNPDVILCERGIRTFEQSTRFTFDLAAVALLKQRSSLPVIADPSHAAGDPSLVPALALGAIAAGADGLIIEVHPRPSEALSDGHQALTPEDLGALMMQLAPICHARGRDLAAATSPTLVEEAA
jgi:3-deoxy-7-phosphoheptulonate synthase